MDTNTPIPFADYFDERFRKPDGSSYKKRQRDKFVKLYSFPVIRIGWTELIVPALGDARLAELSGYSSFRDKVPPPPRRLQEQPPRRRPGRPRKLAAD